MTKSRLFVFVAAGLILLVALLTLPFQVQVSSAGENRLQDTWPSRTPTPQGGPGSTNTPPPPTDDPGGGPQNTTTPQAGPTNTPVLEQIPTLTPNVTVVLETPPGGYEATAQPCGVPPTVQALGLVNIRSGPGLDYDPIDSLIYLEARPIVGRAEFATWWLIQLPENITGWVANQAVSVQGYTGAVPIVEPPDINGVSPTPGPLWQPTPNPICTPLPTPTPTNTAVVEAAEPTTQAVSNANPTEAPPEPTATPEPVPPTETMTAEPATSTAVPDPTTDTSPPITEEEPPDNPVDDPAASTSSWILFLGIGLVAVGAVSFIFRRR